MRTTHLLLCLVSAVVLGPIVQLGGIFVLMLWIVTVPAILGARRSPKCSWWCFSLLTTIALVSIVASGQYFSRSHGHDFWISWTVISILFAGLSCVIYSLFYHSK